MFDAPYFEGMTLELRDVKPIEDARVLVNVRDFVNDGSHFSRRQHRLR